MNVTGQKDSWVHQVLDDKKVIELQAESAKITPRWQHDMLLAYLHHQLPWKAYDAVQSLDDLGLALLPTVHHCTQITNDGKTFSKQISHPGNSAVQCCSRVIKEL